MKLMKCPNCGKNLPEVARDKKARFTVCDICWYMIEDHVKTGPYVLNDDEMDVLEISHPEVYAKLSEILEQSISDHFTKSAISTGKTYLNN